MKKFLRIVGWIAGVFIVLVLVALVVLKIFFPEDKVRSLAIEKGTQALGRPIDIKTVDLSVWGGLGVELGDVTVANPDTMSVPGADNLLSASYIDVKLAILPLIKGEYKIDRLIINEPAIHLYKSPSGANNYTFAKVDSTLPSDIQKQATPETKAAAAAISFNRVEINGGALTYVDDSSNVNASIAGLNLRSSLRNPRVNFFETSGNIAVGELTVITTDTLPRMGFTIGYDAEYDYGKKQLLLRAGTFEINGIKLSLDGSLSHPASGVTARLSLQSGDIDVKALLNLLPPQQRAKTEGISLSGRFVLDADIDYNSVLERALSYSGTAQLSELTMSMIDVPGELRFSKALVDFKQDNLRMNIEDGSFDGRPLTGHAVIENFDNPTVNGELAGTFNLAYVEPFLPVEANHKLAGMSEFNLKFSGPIEDYENLDFSGEIKINNGRYTSNDMPFPLDSLSADVYFDRRLTKVNKFSAYTNSGFVNFTGRITDLVPYILADSAKVRGISPSLDGKLTAKVDLSIANRFLPPKGNPKMTGDLDMDVSVTGSLDRLDDIKPRGRVSVANGSYSDELIPEPVTKLDAELRLSPDTISVRNLAVQFTSTDLAASGDLIDPFPYLLPLDGIDRSRVRKPLFIFSLSSNRFDVDRLFPEAVPGGGEQTTSTSEDSVSTFIFPDVDGRGSFSIDTLIYSKVEFTELTGKVEIHDRKIDVYDTKGKAYSGDVSGRTTIDLTDYENPKYVGEFNGNKLQANDFISRFSKFGGHLFGEANMSGTYNAAGWDKDEFLNSLTMNGNARVTDGRLVTSGAFYEALNGVAKLVKHDNFSKDQSLKSLVTKLSVKDGKVGLDDLKTTIGDMGEVSLGGFYAFTGDVKYNGKVTLSKDWTQRLMKSDLLGSLGGLLGSSSSIDHVTLPLVIDGTIEKPSVKIDAGSIADQLKGNMQDQGKDLLKGLKDKLNK